MRWGPVQLGKPQKKYPQLVVQTEGGGGVKAGLIREKNFFWSPKNQKKLPMTTKLEGGGKALVVGPLVKELTLLLP